MTRPVWERESSITTTATYIIQAIRQQKNCYPVVSIISPAHHVMLNIVMMNWVKLVTDGLSECPNQAI